MCPPNNNFRYQPHVILAEHPRLFEMKCLRVTSFNETIIKLCPACYETALGSSFLEPNTQHALILSDPYIQRNYNCDQCNTSLYRIESALSCNDCFRSYFNLVYYVRCRGHNPQDIHHLYFDVLKEKVTRLTILSEDPIEEATHIFQYQT